MAKRKPLPRLTTEQKVKRLVAQDRSVSELDNLDHLERRPPMAGRSYALSLMGTEHGSDPAKIEARARTIAKMRADAERDRVSDLIRRGLLKPEEKLQRADIRSVPDGRVVRGYSEEAAPQGAQSYRENFILRKWARDPDTGEIIL